MRYCLSVFALLFVLFGSSCSLFEEECDSAPDAEQSDSFFVNQTGFGNCPVVAPGFMNILDWGYFYGSDGQKNGNNSNYTKFRWTFNPPTGFYNEDGTPIDGELITSDNTPHIYASWAAADQTEITVQAFNDCGESETAVNTIDVQHTNVVEHMRPSFPHRVSNPVVGHYEGKLYILFGRYVGGYGHSNGQGEDVFIYDIAAQTWSTKPLPDLTTGIWNDHATVQVGSKIYMFEYTTSKLTSYDMASHTLTKLTQNPDHNISGDYDGVQALYYNGKIYVGPGRSGSSSKFNIFTYDIENDSWAHEHTMSALIAPPQGEDMHNLGEAAFLLNNKIYFLMDGNLGYEYDPVTKTGVVFSLGFSNASVVASAFVVNNTAYAINNGNGSTIRGQLYKFNPDTWSFSVKQIFQNTNCVSQHEWVGASIKTRTLVVDNLVYMVGGERECGFIEPCVGDYFYRLHISE